MSSLAPHMALLMRLSDPTGSVMTLHDWIGSAKSRL